MEHVLFSLQIFAPTGKLNTDTADSRLIYDAAKEAAKLYEQLQIIPLYRVIERLCLFFYLEGLLS